MALSYLQKYLRPVEPGDITRVAKKIRRADLDELRAATGIRSGVRGLLAQCVAMSTDPRTITSPGGSGEPVALLGISRKSLIDGDIAQPWMIGTDSIFDHPRAFLIGGRDFVRESLLKYGKLENYVDVRNRVSVSWLKAIGFTLHEPEPYGPEDFLFHRFTAELQDEVNNVH